MRAFIKRHPIKSLLLAVSLLFAVSLFVLYNVYERRFYESLIPAPIAISAPFVIDGKTAGFRGGCGVASFWLSDATLKAIRQQGLEFFAGATQAWRLTPLRKRDKHTVVYAEWEPTPDKTLSSEWWPAGFACVDDLSRDWKTRIAKAMRAPGSYYTNSSGGSKLFVLPDLKIIILIYFD